MNYSKIYDQIIERAKTRKLSGYVERHHILPKCIGGCNNKSNIVELTAREHFICHWLLTRVYPGVSSLAYAFWGMCNQKSKYQSRYIPSSRTYAEARFGVSKPRSEEVKLKISLGKTGKKRPDVIEYNKSRIGNHPTAVKVLQICKDTSNIVAIYNSVLDASSATGVKHPNISRCFSQPQRTAGGYIWKKQ